MKYYCISWRKDEMPTHDNEIGPFPFLKEARAEALGDYAFIVTYEGFQQHLLEQGFYEDAADSWRWKKLITPQEIFNYRAAWKVLEDCLKIAALYEIDVVLSPGGSSPSLKFSSRIDHRTIAVIKSNNYPQALADLIDRTMLTLMDEYTGEDVP